MAGCAWVPLESNPEVMSKFLYNLGMPQKWAVTDVFGLDEVLLAMVPRPVFAVILLFPLNRKREQEQISEMKTGDSVLSKNVYFMKQTVKNACGTVALIHSVCNNISSLGLGPDTPLLHFFESTKNEDPVTRGKQLETNAQICTAHKESAQEGQTQAPDVNEDVDLHFIALVHVDGHLYELDGRKDYPINHGQTTPESLLQDAAVVCKQYMSRDPDNVNFTVVALAATDT